MATALHVDTPHQRLAHARAVLEAAEQRASRYGGPHDRSRVRALTSTPDSHSLAAKKDGAESAASLDATVGESLRIPEALHPLIPSGTLRAGSTVAIHGDATNSLLLAMSAAAAGEEGWCAFAGMPDLGLRSAIDAGLDPTRLAILSDYCLEKQPRLPQMLSALIEGVSVVALGASLRLTEALWRSLTARARTHNTLILCAQPPGRADLVLTSHTEYWSGLGRGTGRLRTRTVSLSARGRGIAPQPSISVLLPEARGLLRALSGASQHSASSFTDPVFARPEVNPVASADRDLSVVRRAG